MKVGIYGQFYHENSGHYVQQLLDLLDQKGVEVIIEENFLRLIHENDDISKTYSHFSTFEEFIIISSTQGNFYSALLNNL